MQLLKEKQKTINYIYSQLVNILTSDEQEKKIIQLLDNIENEVSTYTILKTYKTVHYIKGSLKK